MGVYENGPAHIFWAECKFEFFLESNLAICIKCPKIALVISVEKRIRYLHKWFCIVIVIMVLFA